MFLASLYAGYLFSYHALFCFFSRPTLENPYRPLGPWYVAAKDPLANLLYVTNSPESLEGDEAR